MIDTTRLRRDLGLSRTEAAVLELLLTTTTASTSDVAAITSNTRTIIMRLRHKLADRITIRSRRELGYWIDPETRVSLLQTYDDEFRQLPEIEDPE